MSWEMVKVLDNKTWRKVWGEVEWKEGGGGRGGGGSD